MAINAKFNTKISLDRDFETLYPLEENRNWKAQEKKAIERVKNLASSWSRLNPSELAQKIAQIEQDASSHDIHWPRYTPYLCYELSSMVKDPLLWGNVLIENSLSSEFVLPFFKRAAVEGFDAWAESIYKCLDREAYIPVAITVVLTSYNTPNNLIDAVFQHISGVF